MFDYAGTAREGFEAGRKRRSDMETQRAMAALVGNPNDPQAMQRLAQYNAPMAMQMQQRQQQQAQQEIEANRDKILMGAQIFRAAKAKNPTAPDEQVYASILPILGQAGINPQGLPQPGDPQLPQFLQGIMAIADGLKPMEGQQAKHIPVQAGGQVLKVNPDGTTGWLVAPEGTPDTLTDDDIMRLEGGQSGQPTGGFL